MRKIKKMEGAGAVTYVPAIGGNRDEAEPFEVTLTPMSGSERLRVNLEIGKAQGGLPNFMKRAQELVDRIISEHVIDVRGYAITGDAGEIVFAPKNGEELIKAVRMGPSSELALLDELQGAIEDASKLEDGARKNSNSPSVSV